MMNKSEEQRIEEIISGGEAFATAVTNMAAAQGLTNAQAYLAINFLAQSYARINPKLWDAINELCRETFAQMDKGGEK